MKALDYFVENWDLFLKGFGMNILYTVAASVLPLLVGIVLCLVTGKKRVVANVFSWLSLPMECLCSIALLLVNYYGVTADFFRLVHDYFPELSYDFFTNITVILTLAISFVGYMPARHNTDWSRGKNILYHGLGLVSAIFKWSFCASMIAGKDLLMVAKTGAIYIYDFDLYLVPLLAAAGVLLVLEIARRLVKQLMK